MHSSNLDLHHRAGVGPPQAMEALESRLLLSVPAGDGGAPPAQPAPPAQHGFSPIRWHGRDMYARTAQWIVKFDSIKGDVASQIRTIQDRLTRTGKNLHVRQQLGDDGLVLIKSPTKSKYKNLTSVLKKIRGFRFLEPNLYLHAALTPDDPIFGQMSSLHNTGHTGGTDDADIDAPEAWEISTGSSDVVVGILDTGIDYNHPDLAANIWINPFEIDGDEIDNDGNGYIDDIHGWDFANDDSNPMDDHGHGTHVSGTVAAIGNNGQDVAGVSWSSKLMALKMLDASGNGELAAAIAALNYVTDMALRGVNIRVTNNSYGDPGFSAAFEDAVRANEEAGMLFVAAAGNGGSDGVGDNNDASGYYPATSDLPNVISVAATDHLDGKANFSNFGATTVDIGAPGQGVWSTARGGGVTTMSGTSMATPHVVGAAALAFAISPRGTDYAVIRDAIFAGGDVVSAMSGITATGRRLNAHGTLALLPLNPVSSDPAHGGLVNINKNDFRIGFSHPVSAATVDAADLSVNGRPADSVTMLDSKTAVFHFDISPLQVQGEQTLEMAAGAVMRDVDLAISGGYAATFRYDSQPMEVFHASLIQEDGIHLELVLNEPVDASSVNASDLVVSQGAVSSVQVLAADLLRFTLTGISGEATLHYSLPAGSFLDRWGNPSLAGNGTLEIDFTTTALPAPLPMINPAGAMIRGTSAVGLINLPGDSDAFTISLSAGQRLSLAVVGQDGLRPTFELLDPLDQPVDSASTDGSIARLDDVLTTSSGLYTVVVSDIEETEGRYTLHVAVNADFESETFGGGTNNDIGTAFGINSNFQDLGNGGQIAAIAAKSDLPAGVLPAEVEPNNSLATSNNAARNLEPASPNLYQMSLKGRVTQSSDDDYFAIGQLQEEDILTITVSGVDGRRGTLFDPFLELYRLTDAGPVRVIEDDDSGTVRDALTYRFEIPESGEYVVLARSWRDDSGIGGPGTYELGLLLENVDAPPLMGAAAPAEDEPNDSIATGIAAQSSWRAVHYVSQTTGSIAGSDHDFSSYIFQQGDIVTIEVEATGTLHPRISLKRSSGSEAAADDGTAMLPGLRAGIFSYTIPASGTYHLEIYRRGESGAGNYTSRIYLSTSTPPQLPTPIADYYSFQLEAGQQASVVVNQNAAQPMTLQLQNAAGMALANGTTTPEAGQVAIANFIAPSAGTYYLRTTGQRLADYTLLVMRDAAFDLGGNDTSAAAQSVASTSNVLGYWQGGQEWYSIPMTAGQSIQLLALTPGGTSNSFDPTISIHDPAGTVRAADDNGAGDGDARLIYKADTSGIHRIAINGDGSGEYLLSITRFWSLQGTSGDDHYFINRNPADGQMQIFRGPPSGQPQYMVADHELGIVGIDGRGGNDELIVDGAAIVAAAPLASTNLSITLRNSAQISLLGSPKLSRLTLESRSWAALTSGPNVLRLSDLQISHDSRLALQEGALILQTDEATRQAMLQMLTDRIRQGRAGGDWSGNGITATSNLNGLHTLGISGNNTPSGGALRSSFLGQGVDANSILIKYGRLGDADLDGDIDSDDYARIDAGYGSAGEEITYADGDFDYSGEIDADDYFYIDRGFFSLNS